MSVATMNLQEQLFSNPNNALHSPIFMIFIGLVFSFFIFLSLREFFCWYFKINELISLLNKNLGQQQKAEKLHFSCPPSLQNQESEAAVVIAYLKYLGKI